MLDGSEVRVRPLVVVVMNFAYKPAATLKIFFFSKPGHVLQYTLFLAAWKNYFLQKMYNNRPIRSVHLELCRSDFKRVGNCPLP